MTSEGLGEMFEGDSAETGAGKFPLVSMGGRAEGLACADPGARTPIGASGNFSSFVFFSSYRCSKPQKGLSQGFKFLHGPLKKNNNNSGKEKKIRTPTP